jgi:hypothetical protein
LQANSKSEKFELKLTADVDKRKRPAATWQEQEAPH